MCDGSLLFFDRPENIWWGELRARIESLEEAQITSFIHDEITEFWLEFTFRGERFSINNPLGELWFFAENANCPPENLSAIVSKFLS